jgi:hypothetical protein
LAQAFKLFATEPIDILRHLRTKLNFCLSERS